MCELISVIVTAHNLEKYIAKSVESICAQKYENLEIIIVDDGSEDLTPQICDELCQKDPRIKVIHKENGGASSARREGALASSGGYIMFVDGDDWINPECIAEMQREIKSGFECVCCGYMREYGTNSLETHIFDGDREFLGGDYVYKFYRRLYGLTGDELRNPERVDSLASVCMKLYPAEAVRKADFIDVREVGSGEDILQNMTTLIHIGSAKYIDKCFYHYRKDNCTSLTGSYRDDLADRWATRYRYIDGYIERYALPEVFREALQNRVAVCMIGYGLMVAGANMTFCQKCAKLKSVLERDEYKTAFKKLDIGFMPLKWKLFFILCRKKTGVLLTAMLGVMDFLRKRKAE